MSFGFGFALPAYPLRGGGGNNPFNQDGATLDLSFIGTAGDLSGADTYTLNTNFITPQYQIAAQYAVWESGVGLAQKTFAQIVTFTRASTATYFNSAGTLTSAAINEARFDFNPSTLAAQGLLIEESRTNSIRNNTMVGAVAGTPGTPPTNWNIDLSGLTGISRQIVGTGTESGVTYIDIRLFGTATVTGTALILTDGNNSVAATASQAWAVSTYVKLQAGSLTGIASTIQEIFEYSSLPAYLRQTTASTFTPTTAGLSTQRSSGSITTGASTAFVRQSISVAFTGGVAADITLRIGLPQLELGAFATSVIPTTTTALTRSADVALMNTLSPWFNATEGTLFAEFTARLNVTQTPVTFSGAAGVGYRIRKSSTNQYVAVLRDGATKDIAITPSPALTEGQIIKVALGVKVNDCALSGGGQAVATQTSFSPMPTITDVNLGFTGTDGFALNGWFRRFTYYPRRLSNADLQAITT
jgi:hypothetical protein